MTAPASRETAAAVLGDWYTGEVGGEALFWRLAELAPPDAAGQWLALAAVEGRVAERLLHVLLGHDLPVPSTEASLEWARSRAEATARRLWRDQMTWLGEIAEEALDSMRRDAAALAPPFTAIASLVLRHEELLVEFAERELSGDASGARALAEEFLAATPRA